MAFRTLFLHFLDVFAQPVQLMVLPAVGQENRMPRKSAMPYPPRFEVCGNVGWITSEAVGSGITPHSLRRRVGPAA